MSVRTSPGVHPAVARALADCRRAFWSVAALSGAVNLLMLAGPIYMLQVYDRVLASRSVPTLIALTALLVAAYSFQGLFDSIRGRIVARSATLLDRQLGTTVHGAVLRLGAIGRPAGEAQQPARDLDQIRSFLTGAGPIAIVDMPWMPAFLAICFLIHPWLGILSLLGALVLIALTLLTERASRGPARDLGRDATIRQAMIDADRRNSETATAMGMSDVLAARWNHVTERYLGSVLRTTDVASGYGSTTRVIRMTLQSAVLGLGAYLVIRNEMSSGAMIAASIMMGRALAPVETAIANWRGFISARQSIGRLSETLARARRIDAETDLPKPSRTVEVEDLVVAAPGGEGTILRDIRFRLVAGEALGVVGPSGIGKTSLIRHLVGIWRRMRGSIRLDGATLEQYPLKTLGQSLGFLSQNIELFDGTVSDNIARMALEPDSDAVISAARAAGAHEMIVRLPKGYDTPIGDAGSVLSAGQRQRVALARAVYGDPFMIVLDEPHSNLDNEGEAALNQAIRAAKARGAVVIIIAHRASALASCDKVLYLANGMQQAFGPRDEVLQRILSKPAAVPPPPQFKVVGETAGVRP